MRQTNFTSYLTDTRFTEPLMSTRHQCEASTWRHEAHFATVVQGCCRFYAPEVVAAGTGACLFSSSSWLLWLLLLLSTRSCIGLRMSADRMDDCTQKLQATVSADVESWQTRFNSLIVQHIRFNRALTPLFYLVPRCQVSRIQSSPCNAQGETKQISLHENCDVGL